jgi:hypothetical protein
MAYVTGGAAGLLDVPRAHAMRVNEIATNAMSIKYSFQGFS